MLSITSAQLDALLLAWIFPLARILGMIGSAPLFSNRGIPLRIRFAVGLIVTVAVAPVLPPATGVQPGSWIGLWVLVQQILIGIGIGMTMRIVMSAIDLAGEIIGLQMGLSFATFFDPNTSAQTAVLAEFISLFASLVFLALNGHLLMIDVMVHSFDLVPITQANLASPAWLTLARITSMAFASGVLISLPVIAALLITNIALAILTRTAPQLNLFAIGFPITMTVGLVVLALSLDNMPAVLQRLFDDGFDHIGLMLKAFGAH